MRWDDFLRKIADDFGLSPKQTVVFLFRFSEENKQKPDCQIQELGEEVLQMEKGAYVKQKREIYRKFKWSRQNPDGCKEIIDDSPHKAKRLLVWLEARYAEHQDKVSDGSHLSAELHDWGLICRKMWEKQKQDRQVRRKATEQGFEVNVYVGLGLVHREQQQRRQGEGDRSQIYNLTEAEVVVRRYEHGQFLTEVIEHSSGKEKKHIAIIGEPGAGKTTLLASIADHLLREPKNNAPDSDIVPIFLSLAGLQKKSVKEYLLQVWLPEAFHLFDPKVRVGEEQQNLFQDWLYEGKVWLLLDGIDEMEEEYPAVALSRIKAELTDWLSVVRVALTCRLNVWDALLNNPLTDRFGVYKTQEFKLKQIDNFISQWFSQSKKPELGKALREKLEEPQRERIQELVRNPLRLSLLCGVFYSNPKEDLPETKAGLYEIFVRYFYEWKQEQHSTKELQRERLNQALGQLAVAGLDNKEGLQRFRLPEKSARRVMGNEEFELAEELGWLNLVDRDAETDEPVYAFFHPTFQEYFAALAIQKPDYFLKHNPYNPNKGIYRIFQKPWEEVFLFWLGQDKQIYCEDVRGKIIEKLINFKDQDGDFYYYRAFFLAARGMTEYKNFKYRDEIFSQLIDWSFIPIKNSCENKNKLRQGIARKILCETLSVSSDHMIEKINSNPLNNLTKEELYELQEASKTVMNLANSVKNNEASSREDINQINLFLSYFQKPYNLMIQHDSLCCDIALLLGEANYSKSFAVNTLVKIIEDELYKNEILRSDEIWFKAIENLKIIDPDNPKIAKNLIEFFPLLKDKRYRDKAISLLKEINGNHGNLVSNLIVKIVKDQSFELYADLIQALEDDAETSKIINKSDLLQIIESCDDPDGEFWQAACHLYEIDPGNAKLIEIIANILKRQDIGRIFCQIPIPLIKNIVGKNSENQSKLVELFNIFVEELRNDSSLVESFLESEFLKTIFDELGVLVIQALEEILDDLQESWYRAIIAKSLLYIQPHNKKAILTFDELLNTTDKITRFVAADVLFDLNPDHSSAIEAISDLIIEKYDSGEVVEFFNHIRFCAKTSPNLVKELERLLEHTDSTVRCTAAQCLTYFDAEHLKAIETLINSVYDPMNALSAIEFLIRLTPSDDLIPDLVDDLILELVKALSTFLKNSISEDTPVYYRCYSMLWGCAQNVDYQTFYKAWSSLF